MAGLRYGSHVTVKFNRLNRLRDAAKEGLMETLKEGGAEVQRRATQNVQAVNAVDTGNLRDSIYLSIPGQSGRPQALAVSGPFFSVKQGRMIQVDASFLASSPLPDPVGMQVVVGVAAGYGLYVEFGTRSMGARPYFFPAVEAVRRELDRIGRDWVARKVAAVA